MKNSYLIIEVFVVLIIGGFIFLAQSSKQPTTPAETEISTNINSEGSTSTMIVNITPDGYVPDKFTIKRNTEVTFVNQSGNERWPASNIHPTHGIYPEFDPKKPLPSGQSWSFKFDKAGIWRFHDHLIPSLVGTITVE
jgi:hypothetical protein